MTSEEYIRLNVDTSDITDPDERGCKDCMFSTWKTDNEGYCTSKFRKILT